jgi:hypothetical protein
MTFGARCRDLTVGWAWLALEALVLIAAVVAIPGPAQAIPSFARQTGQPCGTCHTDFPALTPYGRLFKLNGYTIGGSRFRTTPFPSSDEDRAKPWWPPISTMAIVGFTHTQAPMAPPTEPFSPNDNVVVDPFSFFWGGAITDHIGLFAQVTHVMPPPGGLALAGANGDPFGHLWTWDNTDLRYANTAKLGGLDVVYGLTANNNPTVQDVWNTTPAWGFPFAASTLAPTPSASTIIEGAFAAQVVSAGAYLWINDLLYLEGSAYRTLGFNTLNFLGADPFGAPGKFDAAPYWRAAIEPHWGRNWLMLGTFGLITPVHPWNMTGPVGDFTFPQTDKYTDIGVDAQYQYQGDNYWVTLRAAYIHEHQELNATFLNGNSQNPTNNLNTLKLTGSLAYGGDNRVVLTGQYFNIWGTSDNVLFAGLAGCPVAGVGPCVPDSDGFIAEIAYIPFGLSSAPWWPWFNARIALQYTAYHKFDGTTAGASANNTLFLHLWFAM